MLIYVSTKHKPRRKAKKAPVNVAKKAVKPKFVPKKPTAVDVIAPTHKQYKSKIDEYLAETAPKQSMPIRYEGELALREAAAREEIERKKKCVAPAYNKGAYQYIGSEEQAKWVGKK